MADPTLTPARPAAERLLIAQPTTSPRLKSIFPGPDREVGSNALVPGADRFDVVSVVENATDISKAVSKTEPDVAVVYLSLLGETRAAQLKAAKKLGHACRKDQVRLLFIGHGPIHEDFSDLAVFAIDKGSINAAKFVETALKTQVPAPEEKKKKEEERRRS